MQLPYVCIPVFRLPVTGIHVAKVYRQLQVVSLLFYILVCYVELADAHVIRPFAWLPLLAGAMVLFRSLKMHVPIFAYRYGNYVIIGPFLSFLTALKPGVLYLPIYLYPRPFLHLAQHSQIFYVDRKNNSVLLYSSFLSIHLYYNFFFTSHHHKKQSTTTKAMPMIFAMAISLA